MADNTKHIFFALIVIAFTILLVIGLYDTIIESDLNTPQEANNWYFEVETTSSQPNLIKTSDGNYILFVNESYSQAIRLDFDFTRIGQYHSEPHYSWPVVIDNIETFEYIGDPERTRDDLNILAVSIDNTGLESIYFNEPGNIITQGRDSAIHSTAEANYTMQLYVGINPYMVKAMGQFDYIEMDLIIQLPYHSDNHTCQNITITIVEVG